MATLLMLHAISCVTDAMVTVIALYFLYLVVKPHLLVPVGRERLHEHSEQ